MAITRQKKQELVAHYSELLQRSAVVVVTHYRGMNMNQLHELRTKLSDVNGKYLITKNTLLKLALRESGMAMPEDLLTGPVALGLAFDDVGGTVKVLLDAADNKDMSLEVMGGIMGETVLDLKQLEQLTKLPSLEQIHSQLAGLIASPATNIVSLLVQPARDVVGVLDAASTQVLNVIAAYVAENEAKEAAA